MQPYSSSRATALTGTVVVPGDKSISHRSLMFGALAKGQTRIWGLLEGEDVIRTADALREMGVKIETPEQTGQDYWQVDGTGHLQQPDKDLYMGNSGTSTRLLMGVVGGHKITAKFTGDASLSVRPMARVINPLSVMGIEIDATLSQDKQVLPLTLKGSAQPQPITYESPVASAQVKSAILLAGLTAHGVTTVIEPKATRDHTERMLTGFGAEVISEALDNGRMKVSITGGAQLKGQDITVPGDPSSAGFLLVAALLIPGSKITIKNVCMNKTRIGLLQTLIEMGGRINIVNRQNISGEEIADLEVQYSVLTGINVPAERAPSMIDEYPILAVAASFAQGVTHMDGIGELRVKESDRLAIMASGLLACGIKLEEGADELTIHGQDTVAGGVLIKTFLDHRIAMSFLILGSRTEQAVKIDDIEPVKTSFPDFITLMTQLGCHFCPVNA